MDKNYISSPNDFQHMEGAEPVEFKRTFALDGIGEDESLRLYLRKAGLSDEIEYLTPEQRRAFIFDIIKSNKIPGYWMPSTMTSPSPYSLPPSSIVERAKAPPPPERRNATPSASPAMRRHNNSAMPTILNYATISSNSSTSSLHSLDQSSPIVPRRFQPTPPTPPSPSTFVTSIKGSRYEISGPMNFQHIAGDMTRDRTRNAFDLSFTMDDNVLRKYMLERGIKAKDLDGMRKQDVIRNIVQSKFTWLPPKHNDNDTVSHPPPNVMYATTSSLNERTPPATPRASNHRKTMNVPPPPPPIASTLNFNKKPETPETPPLTPPVPTASSTPPNPTKTLSSLNFLAARFVSPSEFPSIEDIYSNNAEVEVSTVQQTPELARQQQPVADVPAPPPPPPSLVQANANKSSLIYHSNQSLDSLDEWTSDDGGADRSLHNVTTNYRTKAQPGHKRTSPPITQVNDYDSMKAVSSQNDITDTSEIYATVGNRKKKVPPKVPPKPPKQTKPASKAQFSATASAVPHIASCVDILTPPPPAAIGNDSGAPAPPPPPPPLSSGAPLPPPPPPIVNTAAKSSGGTPALEPVNIDNGDMRGALLDSIRKGVALKKVSQKAATISGTKPRAERKPIVTDFLSELKMGITLRRVNDNNHIPSDGEDQDESQA